MFQLRTAALHRDRFQPCRRQLSPRTSGRARRCPQARNGAHYCEVLAPAHHVPEQPEFGVGCAQPEPGLRHVRLQGQLDRAERRLACGDVDLGDAHIAGCMDEPVDLVAFAERGLEQVARGTRGAVRKAERCARCRAPLRARPPGRRAGCGRLAPLQPRNGPA